MLKRQIAKTPFRLGDAIFDRLVKGSGILVLLLLGGIIISLIIAAWPSINQFGFGFLWHKEWDAPAEQFGALVPIYGTLVTSVIALLIAVPVSFGIAIFLTEIAPNWLKRPLGIAIELLAAIPSIVYGMWGLFVFVPLFADYFQMPVNDVMANIPILNLFFTGPAFGISILAAGFILSIMIIPYIASVMRDVFEQTPVLMKEAAYGVGSTKWECIRNIVLPYTKNGVIGGIMLGLGRALGETMAVTFIIGNTFQLDSLSLFMPGSTITSVLANEFAEAESGLHTAALMELGLILFFITFIVLGYSKYLILKLNKTSAKSPKSTFKKTIRWVLLVLVCLELIRIQFYENDTPDLQYSALVILAFIVIACVFKLIMSKLLATRSVTKTTHWRQIKNKIALNLASLAVIFGLFWLMWILFSIIEKGFGGLSWDIFTEMTPSPNTAGGGLANAIMGSSLLVVFATLIGTPLGMLAGIYLAEYGKKNLLASVIRFINDILLSAPSIIIGLFVYMLVVVKMGHFSGLAGIIALALIQLPIIVRTTENMLLLIPNTLREAAYALGTPRWKVILNITLKASLSGIVTGVLLAIARIAGETAPLLFTALSNQFWSTDLLHPMANLPVTIFKFAMSPFIEWQQLAWVGVLIITIFVLLLNILARVLFRNKNKIKS